MTTCIILSAFGDRLRSDPEFVMDSNPEIRLPIFSRPGGGYGHSEQLTAPLIKIARFVATDKHAVMSDGQIARIYEWVPE